jgi:hypothetical protein
MKHSKLTVLLPFIFSCGTQVWACSSCGCSLSSDWGSQGVATDEGLRLDLRFDSLNQNQMRSGTAKAISTGEQELYTRNRYLTAALDYNWNERWGINVQLPYIQRSHATLGDPATPAFSASKTDSVGDVKVIARYAGFGDGTWGVQFGLKLPTGSHTQRFNAGDAAGTPLDRGLQPGTGTTDVIAGVYRFGIWSENWDYFVQALAQLPTAAKDDFKPGNALNVNVGFRYMGFESFTPQLQINARISGKDAGAQASPNDSGGKTIYLSPGVTVPVNDRVKVYGFVQLPVYQNLNGFQLAPRYTVSVGTRIEF